MPQIMEIIIVLMKHNLPENLKLLNFRLETHNHR
jgi:hypothetical protein